MDLIFDLLGKEKKRQEETLTLIPSENYASKAVCEAVGSCLGNKYAEGYPGRRYYQGMEFVDQIETLAIDRAKKLFGVSHANVQPYSGSPANAAVYFALLNPGDKIMGLKLPHGGHLTHGHPKITFAGKYFQSVQYEVGEDGLIDYGKLAAQVKEEKPKLIVAGFTAYPRIIDWQKFGEIADSVGAYLLADISHVAGLIVGGVYQTPVPYAHILMTTTHKTLRGPRGAILMVTEKGMKKDPEMGTKIDKAVFPGLQGGPHLNTIAGIAICLEEASIPEFKEYASQVIKNANALAESLLSKGFKLITGGTDSHLLLLDLREKKIDGATAAIALEKAGLVVNKNTIPFDPGSPAKPSGIRLGTPGVTTRGMKEVEMEKIAEWISQVVTNVGSETKLQEIREEVKKLAAEFPIYHD